MSQAALFKRLALVWVVMLAALNYVALLRIGTGAAKVPDLQGIYDGDGARAFLAALTPDTRMIYLETYLPLDFAFITLTCLLAIFAARAFVPRFFWIIALAALAYAVCDVTENLTLRGLVKDRNAEICHFGCEAVFDRLIWATRLKFLSLLGLVAALAIGFRQRNNA